MTTLKRIGPAGSLFDLGQDKGVSFEPGDVVELSTGCALDCLRDSPGDWAISDAPALPVPNVAVDAPTLPSLAVPAQE